MTTAALIALAVVLTAAVIAAIIRDDNRPARRDSEGRP